MGLKRLAKDGKSADGGTGYLSGGEPVDAGADPEFLDKEAIVLHVGDFDSQDGPVSFNEKRLKLAVETNNGRIKDLATHYGGADKIPLGEYPRVMEDHEGTNPSRATIGRMMGPFSIVKIDVPKLGLKDIPAIKCGKVRFLGKENAARARDGRIYDLSLGVNEKMGDLFDELSAVGEGAAPGARLLSRARLSKAADYKGFRIDRINGEYHRTDDQGGMHVDKRAAPATFTIYDEQANKLINMEFSSIDEAKRYIDSHSKGGHRMAKKLVPAGTAKKRLAKLVQAVTTLHLLRGELGTAQTKLVTINNSVRLAARRSKIDGEVRGLIRLGKMTPAEYKNLKLDDMAKLDDSSVKICLSAFTAREKPVIEPGQRGSLDAVEQGALAKELGKKRLRAQTRDDMKRMGAKLSPDAEAEHAEDKKALAGERPGAGAPAPKKEMGAEGDGNEGEAHLSEYKKHMADLKKHLAGGNVDEAKKSFDLAEKMSLGSKHMSFGDGAEEGDTKFAEMQEQLDNCSTLVSKLAGEVDKILSVSSDEGGEELAGGEPEPGKEPGKDDDAA